MVAGLLAGAGGGGAAEIADGVMLESGMRDIRVTERRRVERPDLFAKTIASKGSTARPSCPA
jgi:hypothetical protein